MFEHRAYEADTLLLEPIFQPILLGLFWIWGLLDYLSWPQAKTLLISASQVARIKCMSLAVQIFFVVRKI
jgi:hypothetical protein